MNLLLTQQILGVPICVLIYAYISIVCTASKLWNIHSINHVTNRYWLSLLLWRLFLMLKPTCVPPLSATNQNYTVRQNPTEFCPKKWMYPSTLRARPQSVFKKVQERCVTAEREVEARFAINNSVFKTFFLLLLLLFKNSGRNEIWRAGGQWNRKVRRFKLPRLPRLLTARFTAAGAASSSALASNVHMFTMHVSVWSLQFVSESRLVAS